MNLDAATVVSWLLGTVASLGGCLIWLLIWFALRMVAQLDRIESTQVSQMASLDKRLLRLEVLFDRRKDGDD